MPDNLVRTVREKGRSMGQILAAACSCGFTAENLYIGGGMMSYETFCGVPTLCLACDSFDVRNYLDSNARCACGGPVHFYTEESLQEAGPDVEDGNDDQGHVFSWHVDNREIRLPDTTYRCPACGMLALQFIPTGHWD
jgi:hypothetical protein